jgi:hypothetical protein
MMIRIGLFVCFQQSSLPSTPPEAEILFRPGARVDFTVGALVPWSGRRPKSPSRIQYVPSTYFVYPITYGISVEDVPPLAVLIPLPAPIKISHGLAGVVEVIRGGRTFQPFLRPPRCSILVYHPAGGCCCFGSFWRVASLPP